MIQNYLLELKNLKLNEINQIEQMLNPPFIINKIEELTEILNNENWKNNDLIKELNIYQSKIKQWEQIVNQIKNFEEILELSQEELNLFKPEEIEEEYKNLLSSIQELHLLLMFNEKYDNNNALVSIHAGAGGKEAQDWAEMLLRMYCLWANKHNFKCNILDYQSGDDSNICKSATIEISGENVYGLLKHENGVHRLIRVSPFDSQGRRHTSFAAIDVVPAIEINNEVFIDPKDLQIDTYRSSGAGGQHVNKTESAIRITHIPTGIVVACQNERSQHQNKEYAMKILTSKLVQIKEEQHLKEISDIQGEQKQIQWGSQIRSYIFMPYQMVKDHRSNWETGNIESIMNGNIDDLIYSNIIK